ncbi:MAG: tetratricopeptide repeat protein [Treponema sp.]|jgi:tetratricopeptide (TPR) repeat protein|nr:tetratricopeptide repeat protein [Treponema sp.]
MQNLKNDKEKDSQKISITEMIVDFIQKKRKAIVFFAVIIAFLFVGMIVYLIIKDGADKRDIVAVEELSDRFGDLILFVNDEDHFDDIELLLSDLISFAGNKKGFAASKAWSLAARIHGERKDWPMIEEAWLNAARAGERNLLGPISLFNAAVAAEEQGKLEQAIDLLKQSLIHRIEFPGAVRAQFSLGRLYEQQHNYPEAIEAYRSIMTKWPDISEWQELARNRIIALEIR